MMVQPIRRDETSLEQAYMTCSVYAFSYSMIYERFSAVLIKSLSSDTRRLRLKIRRRVIIHRRDVSIQELEQVEGRNIIANVTIVSIRIGSAEKAVAVSRPILQEEIYLEEHFIFVPSKYMM